MALLLCWPTTSSCNPPRTDAATQLRITTSCSPTSGATRLTSPAARSAIITPSSPSWVTSCPTPTSSPSLRPPMAGVATSTAATCASRSVSEYYSPSRPPSCLFLRTRLIGLLCIYPLCHLPTYPDYTQCKCASRCSAQCSLGTGHLHLDAGCGSCIELHLASRCKPRPWHRHLDD